MGHSIDLGSMNDFPPSRCFTYMLSRNVFMCRTIAPFNNPETMRSLHRFLGLSAAMQSTVTRVVFRFLLLSVYSISTDGGLCVSKGRISGLKVFTNLPVLFSRKVRPSIRTNLMRIWCVLRTRAISGSNNHIIISSANMD